MDSRPKVGVVGAGMMGAEIALCFAAAGMNVVLKDSTSELAEQGKARIATVIEKAIRKGKYPEGDKAATLARIVPTADYAALGDVDVLIEAVFEDFEVKQSVFQALDDACQPGCLFVSNTSSIPITRLAATVGQDRRPLFLGAHFFSPAFIMKLVEVIPGLESSEQSVQRMLDLIREIGKTPVRVKDVPGFAVNRILHVMLIEANRLVDEGVISPEDADMACKMGLGHPIGPHQLMDLTGNHLCLQVQRVLYEAYGERFRPRPNLKQKVDALHLGRRTGRGWFVYDRT